MAHATPGRVAALTPGPHSWPLRLAPTPGPRKGTPRLYTRRIHTYGVVRAPPTGAAHHAEVTRVARSGGVPQILRRPHMIEQLAAVAFGQQIRLRLPDVEVHPVQLERTLPQGPRH